MRATLLSFYFLDMSEFTVLNFESLDFWKHLDFFLCVYVCILYIYIFIFWLYIIFIFVYISKNFG